MTCHVAQQSGQVYPARMGKHHKIGRTGAVGRRMYELAIQLPETLTLVHVLQRQARPSLTASSFL